MILNRYKIILPVAPDADSSFNEVVGFSSTGYFMHKLKTRWEDLTYSYVRQLVQEKELPEPFRHKIGIEFRFYFQTIRRRDYDNYFLACKGIMDGLVKADVLKDDSTDDVEQDGIRFYKDPDSPRVEVEISEYVPEDESVFIDPPKDPILWTPILANRDVRIDYTLTRLAGEHSNRASIETR